MAGIINPISYPQQKDNQNGRQKAMISYHSKYLSDGQYGKGYCLLVHSRSFKLIEKRVLSFELTQSKQAMK